MCRVNWVYMHADWWRHRLCFTSLSGTGQGPCNGGGVRLDQEGYGRHWILLLLISLFFSVMTEMRAVDLYYHALYIPPTQSMWKFLLLSRESTPSPPLSPFPLLVCLALLCIPTLLAQPHHCYLRVALIKQSTQVRLRCSSAMVFYLCPLWLRWQRSLYISLGIPLQEEKNSSHAKSPGFDTCHTIHWELRRGDGVFLFLEWDFVGRLGRLGLLVRCPRAAARQLVAARDR